MVMTLMVMDYINQDIVGENCELALTDEAKMKTWFSIMLGCLTLSLSGPTAGTPPSVSTALVSKAINR